MMTSMAGRETALPIFCEGDMADRDLCLEELENLVLGGETRSTKLLPVLARCFVVMGRRVHQIDIQVNGNGDGISLRDKVNDLNDAVEMLKGPILTQKTKDSDTFKAVVNYFVDKILPTLITACLAAIVTWVALVNEIIILAK